MNRLFTRSVSVCLLFAMLLSLVGGGSFPFTEVFAVESKPANLLPDLGFEGDSLGSNWSLTNATHVEYAANSGIGNGANKKGILMSQGAVVTYIADCPEGGERYAFNVDTWTASGRFRIQVECLNSSNAVISTPVKTDYSAGRLSWNNRFFAFEAPDDTAKFRVSFGYLYDDKTGQPCASYEQYIDNVSLLLMPDTVMNSDFEQDTIGGTVNYWYNYSNKDHITNEVVNLNSKMATPGNTKALHVADSSNSHPDGVSFYSNYFAVVPGTTYSIFVDTWVDSGKTFVPLYVQFLDENMQAVGSILEANTGERDSWQTKCLIGQAPSTAAYARLLFSTGKSGVVDMYVDNIRVQTQSTGADIAPNDNLLKNSGFDNPITSAEWTLTMGERVEYPDSVATQTNKYGVLLTDNSNSNRANLSSHLVAITPGKHYVATADCFTVSGSFQLNLHFYDKEGKLLKGNGTIPTSCGSGDGWRTRQIEFVAPAAAVYASVSITSSLAETGCKQYVDNVYFMQTDLPKAPLNGSFEQDVAGQTIDHWYGLTTHEHFVNEVVTLEGEMAEEGNTQALHIADNSTELAGLNLYSNYFAISSGSFCTVLMDTWTVEGREFVPTYIQFFDASMNYLKGFVQTNPGKTNCWQTTSIIGCAPEGTAFARILFQTNSHQSGNMYVDNVRIQIQKVNGTPNYNNNALENNNFEAEVLGDGWAMSYAELVKYPDSIATANNKQGILMTDNTANGSASLTSHMITVTPGKFYIASVDTLTESGNFKFILQFYDAEGVAIRGNGKREIYCANGNGMWLTRQVEGLAPANAVTANIQVISMVEEKGSKQYIDNAVLVETDLPDDVLNSDFESDTPGLTMDHWYGAETKIEGIVAEVVKLTGDYASPGNTQAMHIANTIGQPFTVQSHPFAVEVGKEYCFKLETWSLRDPLILWLQFYDKDGNYLNQQLVFGTAGVSRWMSSAVSGIAPEGAYYGIAKVGTASGQIAQDAYIDNVQILQEGDEGFISVQESFDGLTTIPAKETVPEGTVGAVNGYFTVDPYQEHPRTYTTPSEMEEMKVFFSDSNKTVYGFTGEGVLGSCISKAEVYLKEVSFSITCKKETWYFNTDKLVDPNFDALRPDGRPIFSVGPEGSNGTWTYMENYGAELQNRMQTLAFAYAYTGDARFGDRAVQYLMDMCEWQYWADYWNMLVGGTNIALKDTYHLLSGAATVYDMCYYHMTPEQRAIAKKAIMEKGIDPCYQELDYLSLYNKHALRTSALVVAAIAVADETNADKISKILTKCYNFFVGSLDVYQNNGAQEGLSYSSLGLEAGADCMRVFYRYTGNKDYWMHEYLNDTLVKWALYFTTPDGSGWLNSSDGFYDPGLFAMMSGLTSITENALAGYYLVNTRANVGASVAHVVPYPVVANKEMIDQTVTFLDNIDFGSLRTGMEEDDMMMTIVSTSSRSDHNHFDANSITLSYKGKWVVSDGGYAEYSQSDFSAPTLWGRVMGHSLIYVDGFGQLVKGSGSLQSIVSSKLYGQLKGSAPNAYGAGFLTQADRDTILINHEDKPYYVVLDELDSETKHVYTWNLLPSGMDRLEVDGKEVVFGSSASGNHVAIGQGNMNLFAQFIGKEPLEINSFVFEQKYGPTVQASTKKLNKAQFMTVLNIQETESDYIYAHPTIDANNCTATWNNEAYLITDVKRQTVKGVPNVFFRARDIGDAITFPITISESGEFVTELCFIKWQDYGKFKIYLDGVEYGIYDGYSTELGVAYHEMGTLNLEAGEHKLTLELVEYNLHNGSEKSYIGFSAVVLKKADVVDLGLGQSEIVLEETYDDATVLGAKLAYTADKHDIILMNRATGNIAAGDVKTDGQVVTILGVAADGTFEGFTAEGATYVQYGDQILFASDKPVNIAVDYRGDLTVNTTATTDTNIKVYAIDGCYNITANGITAGVTMEGALATFAVAAGETETVLTPACTLSEYVSNHDATCTADGTKSASCTVCGKSFTFLDYRSKLPHTFDQEVVDPKYAVSGNGCTASATYYKSCSCGAASQNDTFAIGEIGKHNLTAVEAKKATADEDGNIAYWTCPCGKWFADADGNNEITDKTSVVIPKGTVTNDSVVIIVVVAVVVVLGLGAGAAFLIIKKKRSAKPEQ